MTRKILAVSFLILLVSLQSEAMRRPPKPLIEALSDATLVVHAIVESAESQWIEDEWGRHIWTTYSLRVVRTLKGHPGGEVVTLRLIGGSIGDQSEMVFDVTRPYLHQEAVFILKARDLDGALAIEETVQVVAGEVQLGSQGAPMSVFAEAVKRLLGGDAGPMQSILPTPTVSIGVGSPGGPRAEGRQSTPLLGVESDAPKSNPYAYFYNAWWEDPIDVDGDGYVRSAELWWDADVSDGLSTLTVYFDVYVSPAGMNNWALIGTVGPRNITGLSPNDAAALTITGSGSPALYDFALGVRQSGSSVYDDELYPWDDYNLGGLPFEGADHDVSAPTPVITSVVPDRAPAGTGDQVTITGTGFGSTQGIVAFFFQRDQSGAQWVYADIVSWIDTRIVCTVPICQPSQGECGGYPGSASSGPMGVVNAAGGDSAPEAFEVPFGYGGRKWNPAQVNYRISTSMPSDFRTAVDSAFATWDVASGIQFSYAGSTSGSTPTQNNMTELFCGPLPPGCEGAIACALCWGGPVIQECDVLFNEDLSWSTAPSPPYGAYDVETVALHEFGHWLELRDLYGIEAGYPSDADKVMFGFGDTGPAGVKRQLHADDRTGVQWIYGAGSGCTYSISPTSASYSASGGSGSFSVTTQAGCTWTATSNNNWIHITGGASGTGNGTVSYSVDANGSSSSRTGTISAADKTFTITQSGATSCTYSISPTSATYGANGGNGTFSVTTQAGCAWTAASNNNWIHITGGASGTGNGTVSYSVDVNGSSSSRTGTISAADKTFSITQAGATSCTYSISPTSATYGANGGNGSFSMSTQAGCAWTATSNNNWIHITGGTSGTGNGTVSYSVDANGSSSSRTGTISAADKTFSITQSGTTSCTYSISPTSATYGASGGNGSVSVSTTAGCTWTASSNSSWIHVTSGSSGTGSGAVNYSVDANSGSSRTGTMTVAGHTFTVTQSGGGGGGPYYYEVAGIAHAGGAGGSVWRSTLCVTNMSGSTADLTLVYRMSGNTVTRTHMLQNNRIKEWEDVAVSLFNQAGNTSGAIEIVASLPVMVVARTYNEAPDGTFGQGMPGNDESATLTSGQMGILPQLKKTSSFRTNVGLMNHGASTCSVRIRLFSENGNQLGSTIDTTVPAEQWKQINDVFNEAGVAQCQIGYATIEVLTGGGRIWAYGSVVDNGTGDPTTIPLFIE